MRGEGWIARAAIAGGTLLLANSAIAQSAATAREHFAHGVEHAQHGKFDAAAADFEEAYRLSPNSAVLYNLGQAYVALGKPAQALGALKMYLEKAGANVSTARRSEVNESIAQCQKSVGFGAIEVDVAGAEVWVDGRSIGKAPLREPLLLTIGSHAVTVTLPNHAIYVDHFEVEAQKTSKLAVHLEPLPSNVALAPGAVAQGQLLLETPLLDVRASLDGLDFHSNGTDPVLVPVGTHRVRCARDGYIALENSVDIEAGRVAHTSCNLAPEPRIASARSAVVSFAVSEPGATIQVDGRRSSATARLPSGRHTVRVTRPGFFDWSRIVDARPGFPERIPVQLRPTPEHAKDLADRASTRRTWAYVIGGAGAAFLGTSATLYATNSSRYATWSQDRDALSRDTFSGVPPDQLDAQAANVRNTAVSIQRQDDLALGSAVLGGALLSYAVVSWLMAE